MILALQASALALFAASPTPAVSTAGAPPATAQEPTSEFGEPLFVNGERIPDLEIKRFLALGMGRTQLDTAKFGVIVANELVMREALGEDISGYVVTQAELDHQFAKEIEDFKLKYPTLDPDTEIGRAFLHVNLYRAQSEQAMLFDKLFFPVNPEEWPDLTRELVIAGLNQSWVDDAILSYKTRMEAKEIYGLDEMPGDDPIFVDTLRSVVLEGLNEFSAIDTDDTLMPDGVLMVVDGTEITVDEIYSMIAPYVTWDKIRDAKRFLVVTALIEDYLAGVQVPVGTQGEHKAPTIGEQAPVVDEATAEMEPALITQAQFREDWPDEGRSYFTTLGDYDMLALQVMGFPSLESYALHERLSRSMARALWKETAQDEVLKATLPHTNQITGAARITCEVILISAYDFPNVKWKENGWEWAESRAAEIKKSLDEGANWKETLQHFSEFWDPPIPDTGHTPQFGRHFKGVFTNQTRNQLMTSIGESEYSLLLWGSALADDIFFTQERGTVAGPFKGPHGYYIAKHIAKTPPSSPLNLREPVHRDIAADYFVRYELNKLGQSELELALEEGRVVGLD